MEPLSKIILGCLMLALLVLTMAWYSVDRGPDRDDP